LEERDQVVGDLGVLSCHEPSMIFFFISLFLASAVVNGGTGPSGAGFGGIVMSSTLNGVLISLQKLCILSGEWFRSYPDVVFSLNS
jgi:hypothetical protein